MEENKLAISEPVPLEVLRAVGTNTQIIQAWRDFQALKQVLLFRAIADMLGASDQVAEEAPEAPEDEPEHIPVPIRKPGPDGWTDEELREVLRGR
jgi:hypothetical protein